MNHSERGEGFKNFLIATGFRVFAACSVWFLLVNVWLPWGSWGRKLFALSLCFELVSSSWEESNAQNKLVSWCQYLAFRHVYCVALSQAVKPTGPQFLCQWNEENNVCLLLHAHSLCGWVRGAWMYSWKVFQEKQYSPPFWSSCFPPNK